MIGLLLPLRWMLYQGSAPSPVYGDAPEQRYVWAPPDVRLSEVFPIDPEASANPSPSATVHSEARELYVGEDFRVSAAPDEPRGSTA